MKFILFLSDEPYAIVLTIFDELIRAMSEINIIDNMSVDHCAFGHLHFNVFDEVDCWRVTTDQQILCTSQCFDK